MFVFILCLENMNFYIKDIFLRESNYVVFGFNV